MKTATCLSCQEKIRLEADEHAYIAGEGNVHLKCLEQDLENGKVDR